MEQRHSQEARNSYGLIDSIASSPELGFITSTSFNYYYHNCQISRPSRASPKLSCFRLPVLKRPLQDSHLPEDVIGVTAIARVIVFLQGKVHHKLGGTIYFYQSQTVKGDPNPDQATDRHTPIRQHPWGHFNVSTVIILSTLSNAYDSDMRPHRTLPFLRIVLSYRNTNSK